MPRLTFLALALSISAAPAGAMVIRHDVDDAAYLANWADFPFLFSLYRTQDGHRDCVATLIAPHWAITAGHCAESRPLLDALSGSSHAYPVEIAGQRAAIDVQLPEAMCRLVNGQLQTLAQVNERIDELEHELAALQRQMDKAVQLRKASL